MHYYDLISALKDDADFTLIDNTNRSWRDERFLNTRPIPANVRFAPFFEEGKYDFAILGIDQQCVNPDIGKSNVYKELNAAITDIPKVVINHGTPVYPEFLKHEQMTDGDAEIECRKIMRGLIGENHMVVNSYESVKEWGWGHPIWHGLDPDEWWQATKEPRVISALSPAGCDTYYNRSCMNDTIMEFGKSYGYEIQWARISKNARTDSSWDAYRNFLAKGLVYLDVSFRTPMNRARTEAMLSGCCIVQVEGAHDLDRFARDGENIVLVPNNPRKIADRLAELLANPDETLRIGKEGRKTAMEKFSRARYRQDWLDFVHGTLKIGV